MFPIKFTKKITDTPWSLIFERSFRWCPVLFLVPVVSGKQCRACLLLWQSTGVWSEPQLPTMPRSVPTLSSESTHSKNHPVPSCSRQDPTSRRPQGPWPCPHPRRHCCKVALTGLPSFRRKTQGLCCSVTKGPFLPFSCLKCPASLQDTVQIRATLIKHSTQLFRKISVSSTA